MGDNNNNNIRAFPMRPKALPAPVPTGQRADRDFAQPTSRARENFPRDVAGTRANELPRPVGGRASSGASGVAIPGPTGVTAVPGVDHPGLISSCTAGRKRRGGPLADTRAPKHRLTSLPTVSQPPGVPGSALGNARLASFYSWCDEQGVDPRSAPLKKVVDCLIQLFDKGLAVVMIRSYRSAIAVIHKGFDDGSVVSNAPTLT